MSRLPWYLKSSPLLFLIVAAIKFVEAAFAAVGARAWASANTQSMDASFLVGLKVFDAAVAALAWVATAIIAKLLLEVLSRVGLTHATS